MSQTVATIQGREKLAQARAGTKPLPRCKSIALGVGGVDANGVLKTPTDTETELYDEVIRRDITQPPTFKKSTTATYTMRLLETELANITFNEIGLYDDEDTLIAIKTFNPKMKDGDMEMQFEIDDIF